MDGGVVFFIILAIAAAIVVAVVKNNVQAGKEKAYRDAIARGDKSSALSLGRAYYAGMRADGKLTIYDEQAITNDLSVMK